LDRRLGDARFDKEAVVESERDLMLLSEGEVD
jgi:hypothetical protein